MEDQSSEILLYTMLHLGGNYGERTHVPYMLGTHIPFKISASAREVRALLAASASGQIRASAEDYIYREAGSPQATFKVREVYLILGMPARVLSRNGSLEKSCADPVCPSVSLSE